MPPPKAMSLPGGSIAAWNNPGAPAFDSGHGDDLMEYRRQVTMRRDGDDFVVAFEPDGFIIFRNRDAYALRKLCRSLRWEIVSDTTSSEDELAWSLVPAEIDPAETVSAESDRAKTDADESGERQTRPPSNFFPSG